MDLYVSTTGTFSGVAVAWSSTKFGSGQRNSNFSSFLDKHGAAFFVDQEFYNVVSGHSAGLIIGTGCTMCSSGYSNCPTPEDPTSDCDPNVLCNPIPGKVGSPTCQAYEDCLFLCPLLLDLGADGLELSEAGVGVQFDMLGNNTPEYMQWSSPGGNDAFLVHDLNKNGIVDNGTELFGHGTFLLLSPEVVRPNGFVALSEYDRPELGGNDDGIITVADSIWSELTLWLDDDADGVSQPQEVFSLKEGGVRQLGIIPRETNRYDEAGNWLRYWTSNQGGFEDGHFYMIDVYFKRIFNL